MKISVFTACLPELDLEEQCQLLSKNGFEGIELRIRDLKPEDKKNPYSFWGNHKCDVGIKNLKEKAKEIRKTCDKYKLEICSLGTYAEADQPEAIEEICRNLDTLGVRKFRVGGFSAIYNPEKDNYWEKYETFIKQLRIIFPIIEKYNAKILFETHMGTLMPSAGLMYNVVSKFDKNRVGVILDPGNMVFEGYEHLKMQLEVLKGYISHVHLKNGKWVIKEVKLDGTVIWEPQGCSLWEGVVNVKNTITMLKNSGYDSWLSMEDFTSMETSKKAEFFAKYVRSQF